MLKLYQSEHFQKSNAIVSVYIVKKLQDNNFFAWVTLKDKKILFANFFDKKWEQNFAMSDLF